MSLPQGSPLPPVPGHVPGTLAPQPLASPAPDARRVAVNATASEHLLAASRHLDELSGLMSSIKVSREKTEKLNDQETQLNAQKTTKEVTLSGLKEHEGQLIGLADDAASAATDAEKCATESAVRRANRKAARAARALNNESSPPQIEVR